MRQNLPVTKIERKLAKGEFIVSKTNLKGQLTYVNQPFMEISGFSEEELMGQHHNIIRHPDMPSVAFADLWKTLEKGKPWKGLVKNRCKNGDHYWVEANANPIWENGEITGYMSLRKGASSEQIKFAENVYRQFRDGHANGLTVKEGRIVKSGIVGLLNKIFHPSLGTQISLDTIVSIVCLLSIVLGDYVAPAESLLNHPYTVFSLASVIILLRLNVWWMIKRRFLGRISTIIQRCQTIPSGFLKPDANSQNQSSDELGVLNHALEVMAGNVCSIVNDVDKISGSVDKAINEIQTTSDALSQTATSQAASIEETSAAIEEMSGTNQQNAENAHQTYELATDAVTKALEGNESVTQNKRAMNEINDRIKVVDDIAYQTNLLALNASIEAASAGIHGKSFSVVAGEVGKLADRSKLAAKETSELAHESVGLAEKAGIILDEIVQSITQTSEYVEKINHATAEQSIGVDQINLAMSQLSNNAQQNAGNSKELSITAGALGDQSANLAKAINSFVR